MRGLVASAVALVALVCSSAISHATPDRARWYRESLIGENACCFFRMVSIRNQPGSSYKFSDTLRVESVRKSDLAVVESIPIMIRSYRSHPDTMKWVVTNEALGAFDLTKYIRANEIAGAFPELGRLHMLKLDAKGLRVAYEDGHVEVMSRAEIQQRAPQLDDDAVLTGVEVTGFFGDSGQSGWLYIRAASGSPDYDSNCVEYLLAMPESRLHSD